MAETDKKNESIMPIPARLSKRAEFELFAKWLAISPLFRLLSGLELDKMGIDDPEEMALIGIRNQKEFAEKFGVQESTLVRWKRKGTLYDLRDRHMRMWGRKKTPSVLMGLYRTAVRKGEKPEVELWLQVFEGYVPREKVEVVRKMIVLDE